MAQKSCSELLCEHSREHSVSGFYSQKRLAAFSLAHHPSPRRPPKPQISWASSDGHANSQAHRPIGGKYTRRPQSRSSRPIRRPRCRTSCMHNNATFLKKKRNTLHNLNHLPSLQHCCESHVINRAASIFSCCSLGSRV